MTPIVNWIKAGLSLAVAAAVAQPAVFASSAAEAADTACLVKSFQYRNEGEYSVDQIDIKYTDSYGKEESIIYVTKGPENYIDKGDEFVVDLGDYSRKIEDADHVWIKIHIVLGEEVNCKTNDFKFKYDKNNGVRYDYHSKGETYTNNSCDYSGKLKDDCVTTDSLTTN
jgi:hypothetical protein